MLNIPKIETILFFGGEWEQERAGLETGYPNVHWFLVE
jgi:hypothetical protein